MSQKTNAGSRDPAEFAVVSDDPFDIVPCPTLNAIAIPRIATSPAEFPAPL